MACSGKKGEGEWWRRLRDLESWEESMCGPKGCGLEGCGSEGCGMAANSFGEGDHQLRNEGPRDRAESMCGPHRA